MNSRSISFWTAASEPVIDGIRISDRRSRSI